MVMFVWKDKKEAVIAELRYKMIVFWYRARFKFDEGSKGQSIEGAWGHFNRELFQFIRHYSKGLDCP